MQSHFSPVARAAAYVAISVTLTIAAMFVGFAGARILLTTGR